MGVVALPPRVRRAAREGASCALWVSVSLAGLVASNSAWARRALAVPADADPFSVFLASVAGQIALWDYFDLSVGSTLNPALSLAFAVAGHKGATLGELMHVVAGQCAGHVLAVRAARAAAADLYVKELRLFAAPEPTRSGGLSFMGAVAIEATLTFALALSSLAVGRVIRGPFARSVLINVLVLVLISVGTPFTGAVLNPAMAFALAVPERGVTAALADRDLYVYVAGPCAGAIAAALVYRRYFPDRRKHWVEQLIREREAHVKEREQRPTASRQASGSTNDKKDDTGNLHERQGFAKT